MAHCRIITDDRGRPVDYWILQINEAYERIIGIKKANIEGRRVTEVFPEIRNYAFDYIGVYGKIALEGGEIKFEEFFEATGQYLSIYAYSPLPGEFAAIFTDVTERKGAEAALRESEEHYRSLFDNMLNGFAFCRMHFEENRPVDFTYLEVNRAFESLTGLKNVTGKRVSEVIPGLRATNPEVFEVYGRVALTGRPEQFETYVEPMGMWFLISVYSPQQEHFVAVFDVITERKRAEEALHKTEERLRLALEAADFGTWDLDLVTGQAVRSPRHDQIFGYPEPQSEWTLEIALRHILPEDRQKILDAHTPAPGKTSMSVEARMRRADGSIGWVMSTGRFHYDDQGRPVRIIGVCADITDRKRAEESLRETRDYLEKLFGYANAPIICWDRRRAITRFNPAFERLTGYAADEVIGRDLSMLFPDETRDDSLAKIARALTERWEVVEIPIQRKDGETRVALWNSANVYAEDGTTILATIAQGQDITERKRAEEALWQSEDRFRTMANAIPQLAWIAQADGYIVWYNQRWYQYTATTPEQMEGWGWQSVHDPVELPKVLEQWKASIATGEPFEMTFPLRGADGVFRLFLTRGFPLKDAAGRVVQWFGTNTDVDELKRAEEALRELNATLETRVAERTAELTTANQEMEAFTYSVSHDLRAPLRHVTGFIELLEKRTGDGLDQESQRFVRVISEAAQRMGKLIDDLLMLSRVGRVAMAETDVDLGRVVQEVRQELAPEMAGRTIEWQIGPLPRVRGDATLLRTVLANLLSNAIKYSRNRDPAASRSAARPRTARSSAT